MSCKLVFIRHGQSIGNLTETFLGHTDHDLSELGHRQAERTAEYLKDIHIDCVYSSDLSRAYGTCEAYLRLSGHTAVKSDRLREIYVGLWEGKSFEALKTEFKDSYSVWLNDIGSAKPEGGETVAEFQRRVLDCVTEIAENNDGKTVAIFTHATVIRAFFNYAYGKALDEMKNLKWASNASVSTALFDNGKFTTESYSTDGFLSDLKTALPTNV